MSLAYVLPKNQSDLVIETALEFYSNVPHRLSITPAGTSGSPKAATVSLWFRRSNLNSQPRYIVEALEGPSTYSTFLVDTTHQMKFGSANGGAPHTTLISNETVNDTNWHHVVWRLDFNDGTAANRARIYLDGSEVTYSTATRGSTTNNVNSLFAAATHNVGTNVQNPTSNAFEGEIADVNLVNGSSLGPENFGEDVEGVWTPIDFTGNHGTDGMRFQFLDSGNVGANTASI